MNFRFATSLLLALFLLAGCFGEGGSSEHHADGGTGSSEGYVGGDDEDSEAVVESKIREAAEILLPGILTKRSNGVSVLTMIPKKNCSVKEKPCNVVKELSPEQRSFLGKLFQVTIGSALELQTKRTWDWKLILTVIEAEGTDAKQHDSEARFDLNQDPSGTQEVEFSFPALKKKKSVAYLAGLTFHEQLHILTRLPDRAHVADLLEKLKLSQSVDPSKLGDLKVGDWLRYAARFIEALLDEGTDTEPSTDWLGDPNAGNTILEIYEYVNSGGNTHLYSRSNAGMAGWSLTDSKPRFRLFDANEPMSESATLACDPVRINICLQNPTTDLNGNPVYLNGYGPNAYYEFTDGLTSNGCAQAHDQYQGSMGYACRNAAPGLVPLESWQRSLGRSQILGSYWYYRNDYVARVPGQSTSGYTIRNRILGYVLPAAD